MSPSKLSLAQFILRFGLAFSFLYAGIAGMIEPGNWIGYFPPFLRDLASDNILLWSWGLFEIVIGLWILSGKKIFIPSLLASLSLVGLIATNLGAMDIIFRDISILTVSIALTIENYPIKQSA
jgi:uncharacterized membrane protein YphA (DoxX/SURF4 family)